jgi:hypothetical protein
MFGQKLPYLPTIYHVLRIPAAEHAAIAQITIATKMNIKSDHFQRPVWEKTKY